MASMIIQRIHKTYMNKGKSAASSNREFGRPCALDSAPVDAFQKHRKLCATETDCTALGLRPYKTTALQPLGEQAQTITVPPQQLHDVASAATKYKHVTGERLLLEHRLHLRTQPIEPAPHIGDASGKPDPGPCGKLHHRRRLSRTCRTSAESAPL